MVEPPAELPAELSAGLPVDLVVDLPSALLSLLGADSVTPIRPELTGWGVTALDPHRFVVTLPGGDGLLVHRARTPFTGPELVRAFGLLSVTEADDGPSRRNRGPWQ
jgi:hypothetical protein